MVGRAEGELGAGELMWNLEELANDGNAIVKHQNG